MFFLSKGSMYRVLISELKKTIRKHHVPPPATSVVPFKSNAYHEVHGQGSGLKNIWVKN